MTKPTSLKTISAEHASDVFELMDLGVPVDLAMDIADPGTPPLALDDLQMVVDVLSS